MKRRYYFQCIKVGVLDGIETRGDCLSMGMTWEDKDNDGRIDKNVLYDRCVNLGQKIGQALAWIGA